MDNYFIRTASVDDVSLIQDIAARVWPQTYSSIISAEQIEYMLDMMYSPNSLIQHMTEKNCEFILVSSTERSFGFASFSSSDNDVFRLHKLYVDVAAQGLGLGVSLLKEVSKRAAERGGSTLELNVNKYNKAKTFYEKNGFTIYREEVIDIGNGFVMDDFVMRKSLLTL
jgi:ribosomal protein S18 acetylase RimI-like enzyme